MQISDEQTICYNLLLIINIFKFVGVFFETQRHYMDAWAQASVREVKLLTIKHSVLFKMDFGHHEVSVTHNAMSVTLRP